MDLRKRNSWDDAISIEETAVKAGAVHGAYSATQRRKSRRTSSSAGVSRRSSQGIKASNKSWGKGGGRMGHFSRWGGRRGLTLRRRSSIRLLPGRKPV